MAKIRVAILGQGRSGRNIHAHTFGMMPAKYKVVAVADPLPGRTADSEKEFGCEGYLDYKELLKRNDLDLVINATPSHLHVPVTLEVMEAGHNVICEKPLARKASDVDKLIAKAKERGVFFTAFQQSRFAPYFQQVKKVIDSGVLGRIVMIKVAFNDFSRRWDWQTIQAFNGGNLLNTGPHPLDQALQLMGTDVVPKVTCIMDSANFFGDAEDHVKLILQADGRPTVDFEVSSCCAYPLFIYQLYGVNGGLKGDMKHIDWRYFNPAEAPKQHLIAEPTPNREYVSETLKWHTKSWDVPESQSNLFDTIATRYYTNIYNVLRKGATLEVTPQQVRQQIAVIEECHRQNPMPKR